MTASRVRRPSRRNASRRRAPHRSHRGEATTPTWASSTSSSARRGAGTADTTHRADREHGRERLVEHRDERDPPVLEPFRVRNASAVEASSKVRTRTASSASNDSFSTSSATSRWSRIERSSTRSTTPPEPRAVIGLTSVSTRRFVRKSAARRASCARASYVPLPALRSQFATERSPARSPTSPTVLSVGGRS